MPEATSPRSELNPEEVVAADRSAAGVPGAHLPVVSLGAGEGVVLAGRLTPQLWVWPALLLIPLALILLVDVLWGLLVLAAQLLIMAVMRALEDPQGRWVPAMRRRIFDVVIYAGTGSMILILGLMIPSLNH